MNFKHNQVVTKEQLCKALGLPLNAPEWKVNGQLLAQTGNLTVNFSGTEMPNEKTKFSGTGTIYDFSTFSGTMVEDLEDTSEFEDC